VRPPRIIEAIKPENPLTFFPPSSDLLHFPFSICLKEKDAQRKLLLTFTEMLSNLEKRREEVDDTTIFPFDHD
jgi:hypothetical protein